MPASHERRVWFLEDASNDVVAVFEWYETQRAGLGFAFLVALDAAIVPLRVFPDSCEVFYRDTRRCLLERFPLQVLYRVEGELIVVVACMHAARDPGEIRRRIR